MPARALGSLGDPRAIAPLTEALKDSDRTMREAAGAALGRMKSQGAAANLATAPRGVAGRNSDNTFIKQIFGWEPSTHFKDGLTKTYAWIEQQYYDQKAGKRVVTDQI